MKRTLFLAVILSSTALLQGCTAVAVGAAAGLTAKAAIDPRTVGTQVDDTTLETRVNIALGEHRKELAETRITPTSYNGSLLLSGQVVSQQQAQKAEELAKQIDGIKHVYNQLVVGPLAGSGTMLKDSLITSNVKTQLIANAKTRARNIKVVTEDGTVYLMGIVTPQEAEEAAKVASKVSGVKVVMKIFTYLK